VVRRFSLTNVIAPLAEVIDPVDIIISLDTVNVPEPSVPVVVRFSLPNVIAPLADKILPLVIVISDAATTLVVPANVVNVPAAGVVPPITASTVPALISAV
jgi:hypothetical protein